MLKTIQGLMEGAMYVSQGKIPMSTEGIMVISEFVPGSWAYLTVWSTIRILSLPAVNLFCKSINPKGWR